MHGKQLTELDKGRAKLLEHIAQLFPGLCPALPYNFDITFTISSRRFASAPVSITHLPFIIQPSDLSIKDIACVGHVPVIGKADDAALDSFIGIRPYGKDNIRVLFPKVHGIFVFYIAAAQTYAHSHADIIIGVFLCVAYLYPAQLNRRGDRIDDISVQALSACVEKAYGRKPCLFGGSVDLQRFGFDEVKRLFSCPHPSAARVFLALLGKARICARRRQPEPRQAVAASSPSTADLIHRRDLRYLIFVYPEYNA